MPRLPVKTGRFGLLCLTGDHFGGCSDSLVSTTPYPRPSTPPTKQLGKTMSPEERKAAIADLQNEQAKRQEPRRLATPRHRQTGSVAKLGRPAARGVLPRGPLLWFKCPPVRHRALVGGQRDKTREHRLLPHQAAAALHLRGSQSPQGAGARARRGHHRFRHGQSRHADARAYRATSCARRRAIPRTNRYSASRGIKGLRKAHVAYYKRRFGVKLNPDTRGDRHAGLQGRLRQSGARPSPRRAMWCWCPIPPIRSTPSAS